MRHHSFESIGILLLSLVFIAQISMAQEVTLGFANAGAIESDPATVEIIRAFEIDTGIKVKIVPIPGPKMVEIDYGTLARKETTFDVIEALGKWLPDFIQNQWIAPLDEVFPPKLQAHYSPGALSLAKGADGKIYAFPWYTQPTLVFYRADLVEAAGYQEFPSSWDEFLALCKKLTVDSDGDGVTDQYGFVYAAGSGLGVWDTFTRFLYTAHGSLYDQDGNPIFNSEAGVAALQFMIDLKNTHTVVPETVMDYQEGEVADFWKAGKAAIMWNEAGSLILQALQSKYGPYLKLARLPSLDGKPAPSLSDTIYPVVNVHSRHLPEAKKLAAYLANYRSQWTGFLMEFNVPLFQAVFDSPYIKEQIPFSEAIKDAISRAKLESHRGYAEIQDIVSREIRAALLGEKTAQQALDDAIKEMKRRNL